MAPVAEVHTDLSEPSLMAEQVGCEDDDLDKDVEACLGVGLQGDVDGVDGVAPRLVQNVAVSVVAEGDFPEIVNVTDLGPVELRQQTEPEVELDHDLRDLDGMRSVLFSISLYLSRFYKNKHINTKFTSYLLEIIPEQFEIS